MERIILKERDNWKKIAEEAGFTIHSIYNSKYWDESKAYKFTLREIEENIEDPTEKLYNMCMEACKEIINNKKLMLKMAIPEEYHDKIKSSFYNKDKDFYGRFDLSYNGKEPAKLLEFNADTPTSLYESSIFQWMWLEDMKLRGNIPIESDQFNSIHEKMVEASRYIFDKNKTVYVTGFTDNEEDNITMDYIVDIIHQGGNDVKKIDIREIGIDKDNNFIDEDDNEINQMFKLYPLEFMIREEYGKLLINTKTKITEPIWKLILSNKGILPVLWEMFKGDENLLESYFEEDNIKIENYVRKPLLSREGENVTIYDKNIENNKISCKGEYGQEGYIIQKSHMLPKFGNDWTLIGSWVAMGKPAGIGIREDETPITRNTSRFVPHFILD